jgi:transcriptional regulator with XRE-family HTH domain
MIASPSINNRLQWTFEGDCFLSWFEASHISRLLKERRKDIKNRLDYMTQGEMAEYLNEKLGYQVISQGTISNIENNRNKADIMNLPAQARLELLKLYRFTDDQIAELDKRFNLNLPLHKTVYLNNLGTDASNSAIVWFSNIRNAEPGEAFPVRKESLEGIPEDRFNNLMIAENVLLPPALSGKLVLGTVLFCTPDAEPRDTDTLAYKYRDQERYVVLERHNLSAPTGVVSVNGGYADVIQREDPRLEFLGVTLVESRSRRTRFGEIVGVKS